MKISSVNQWEYPTFIIYIYITITNSKRHDSVKVKRWEYQTSFYRIVCTICYTWSEEREWATFILKSLKRVIPPRHATPMTPLTLPPLGAGKIRTTSSFFKIIGIHPARLRSRDHWCGNSRRRFGCFKDRQMGYRYSIDTFPSIGFFSGGHDSTTSPATLPALLLGANSHVSVIIA